MLTRFSYTVLMFTRSKSLILWALAFPIILATILSFMFSGIDEAVAFSTQRMVVVADDAYAEATGLSQTLEALAGDGSSDSLFDGAVLRLTEASSTEEALDLVRSDQADCYLVVEDGMPHVYFSPDAASRPSAEVVVAVLDRYVHGAAQYRLLAKEKPLALLLPSTAEAFFGDTTPIEELPVTHTDLDSMARYFYAVLAMSAGFSAMLGATVVQRLQPTASALGARTTLAGVPRWRMLAASLAAAWVCAFACLVLAFCYIRFVLDVGFGGREGWCIAACAVASFMATAGGAAVGAHTRGSTAFGALTALTLVLSLFAGLYGTAAMNLADTVSRTMPWLSAINPLWECSRAFYTLMYYDTLGPFAETCTVLVAMGLLFAALAAARLRRQRYAHL